MPIFPAVAASLIQPSSTNASSRSRSANDKFSSHLQAATNKKSGTQHSTKSSNRTTKTSVDEPAAQTTQESEQISKESGTKNGKDREPLLPTNTVDTVTAEKKASVDEPAAQTTQESEQISKESGTKNGKNRKPLLSTNTVDTVTVEKKASVDEPAAQATQESEQISKESGTKNGKDREPLLATNAVDTFATEKTQLVAPTNLVAPANPIAAATASTTNVPAPPPFPTKSEGATISQVATKIANTHPEESSTTNRLAASTFSAKGKQSTVSQMLAAIARSPVEAATSASETLTPNPTIATSAAPESLPLLSASALPLSTITTDKAAAGSAVDQLLAGGSLQTAGKAPEKGQAAATVNAIVFDPATGSLSTSVESGTLSGEPGSVQESSIVVQNKYGQIITIEQNKEASLSPIVAGTLTNTRLVHRDPVNFDLNNRYLHSQLPHGTISQAIDSPDNAATSNDQSQSSLFSGNNQNFDGLIATEQQFTLKEGSGVPQGSQNLSFNYQPTSSQTGLAAPASTEIGSTLYRLGSGNLIPEGAVVDQMMTHFSANKRLESGSVNLKLYPQELGELRMEIKVDQDNVKAHIVAQSPHAQEMIDRHIPRLREALEQQGLHLQQIEVTVAANDNAAGERFQDNTAWQQTRHSSPPKNTPSHFDLELEEEVVESDTINNNLNVIA